MPERASKPFPKRAFVVGLTTMAMGLAVLFLMPRQWLAWSLLLLFAVKHLALVAVAAGPLYAAFGDRLRRGRAVSADRP
jgi:nitrate reductase gamma subunit